MKMAPLLSAFAEKPRTDEAHLLIHTGQHYDPFLNDQIFRDLELRSPDVHLGVGSGTHAEQTSKIMVGFEAIVTEKRPSLVVVAGDVNSTLACAIVAAKACVPVAHVEAGLRSFDRTMPEEVNRIVTDRLTDVFLTPSGDADENLVREGVERQSIVCVGNLMVDSLLKNLERARSGGALARYGLEPRRFALLTLHRPSNVDDEATFSRLLEAIAEIGRQLPVLFPVHPRTHARLASGALGARVAGVRGLLLTPPLGYLDLLQLQDSAKLVLTDSGGIQEESTALGVPCLTLRENTERPITVTEGTNLVVGTDARRIIEEARKILDGHGKGGRIPHLWDGRAGVRAVHAIRAFLGGGVAD
jgi:UDP-N-acetylglucosamine 2-epimerase (non-hydrolysing)